MSGWGAQHTTLVSQLLGSGISIHQFPKEKKKGRKLIKDIANMNETKYSKYELGEIVFQELFHPVDMVQA